MVGILALWLPILLSAVFVFVASSIIHMVLPVHKGDYRKIPGEEEVLAELRKQEVRAGEYMFPCAGSMKEMGTPEMKEKLARGPVGLLTVLPPGGFSMGKNLVLWFLFTVLVGVFVAYITGRALPPGTEYLRVFQIAGSTAILAYAIACIQNSIWRGVPWLSTVKFVVDGVIYGLLTAGTFGWLWPHMG